MSAAVIADLNGDERKHTVAKQCTWLRLPKVGYSMGYHRPRYRTPLFDRARKLSPSLPNSLGLYWIAPEFLVDQFLGQQPPTSVFVPSRKPSAH